MSNASENRGINKTGGGLPSVSSRRDISTNLTLEVINIKKNCSWPYKEELMVLIW